MSFDASDPRLTAFALGELDVAEHAEIEASLAESAEARRFVEEIRATAEILTAELRKESSPGLSAKHYQAIEASLRPAPRAWGRPRWLALAAAACLLFAGTLAVWYVRPRVKRPLQVAFFEKAAAPASAAPKALPPPSRAPMKEVPPASPSGRMEDALAAGHRSAPPLPASSIDAFADEPMLALKSPATEPAGLGEVAEPSARSADGFGAVATKREMKRGYLGANDEAPKGPPPQSAGSKDEKTGNRPAPPAPAPSTSRFLSAESAPSQSPPSAGASVAAPRAAGKPLSKELSDEGLAMLPRLSEKKDTPQQGEATRRLRGTIPARPQQRGRDDLSRPESLQERRDSVGFDSSGSVRKSNPTNRGAAPAPTGSPMGAAGGIGGGLGTQPGQSEAKPSRDSYAFNPAQGAALGRKQAYAKQPSTSQSRTNKPQAQSSSGQRTGLSISPPQSEPKAHLQAQSTSRDRNQGRDVVEFEAKADARTAAPKVVADQKNGVALREAEGMTVEDLSQIGRAHV